MSWRSTRLGAWSALGLAGSLLVALAAPRALQDGVVGWWYHPGFPGSRAAGVALVYVGMALLCIAWLALWRESPSRRRALLIAAAWVAPLALAPPLFSRDAYSYLAQGTILHLGHNPYHQAPVALAALGRPHVLAAVSPFWRHTTAPYGPLFLELISLIVSVTGSHLVAGVLLARVLDLVGLGLLAASMGRLTRALGTDAGRGIWLSVASPLVLLGLVAAGHNDLLMVGLLAAGVALALRGNPLSGIAVCALAATIKVPALVGAVFIAVAWARAECGRHAQLRFLAAAGAVMVVVLGAVTLASGVGVAWLSTSLFATPARVRLAITPSTGVGYTVAALLHDAGVAVSSRGLESAFGVVAAVVTAAGGLWLLYRVRVVSLVGLLGACLALAAAGGPAAWPWYFTWALAIAAACAGAQRSPGLAVALVAGAFVVKPDGILALPLGTAPAVMVLYLALGGWAWRRWRLGSPGRGAAGGERDIVGAAPGRSEGTPSALVRT